jgi:hypothetical protein
VSYRPDAALKQERFFSENLGKFGRTVVRPDGPGSSSGRRPYILQQSPILHLSL